MLKKYNLLSCLFLLFLHPALAQNIGNSPYSKMGIGDIAPLSFTPNIGMGGIGVSNSLPFYINNVNPALLARNRNTVFEVGLVGQYKQLRNTEASQQLNGGNLNYIAFAFPVSPKWTTSIGLRPYSSVNYETRFSQPIEGSDFSANYTYKGNGGINTFYWANGVNVWKGLYIGLKASYFFGKIINESIAQLNGGSLLDYQTVYYQKTNFSDFTFGGGLAYRFKVNSKYNFNWGATYDLVANLKTKQEKSFEMRDITGLPFTTGISKTNQDGNITLPAQYRTGISLERNTKWTIGADFAYQDWSTFKDLGENSQTYTKSYSLGLGAEWIPDYKSIDNYLERMAYRIGFTYSQLPFLVEGKNIKDFGINFGTSLPVSRGLSDLNLAISLGQRGTLENNLIQERYVKLFLGFTINDKWFIKRKID